MKKILFSIALCVFLFGCASGNKAKYKEDPNTKYASARDFAESPETVKKALKLILESIAADALTNNKDEKVPEPLMQESDDRLELGWVQGVSKDKYIEYKFNSEPRRAVLKVRRWYSVNVRPALVGSSVEVSVKEELEKRNLKTGMPEGWSSVTAQQATIDSLFRRLREQINSL